MRIATMNVTRPVAGWLIVLIVAAASVLIGANAPVQARSAEPAPARARSSGFYCRGAAGIYKACEPGVITTNAAGTVTIRVNNHAAGGERCHLGTPTDEQGRYRPFTADHVIRPSDTNRPFTFSPSGGSWPAGLRFVLHCKRISDTPGSDAGIGGTIFYP